MKLVVTTDWDADDAARGQGLTDEVYLKCRTDGRKAAERVTDWLGSNGWRLIPDKRSGQLLAQGGKLFRVRAIAQHGVTFALSSLHGVGRAELFTEQKFEAGACEVDGFLVFLSEQLPHTKVWEVSCDEILQWYRSRILSRKGGRLTREQFLRLVAQATAQMPPSLQLATT